MRKLLFVLSIIAFFTLTGFSSNTTDINVDDIIVNKEEVQVNSNIFMQDRINNSSDTTIMEGVNTVLATIEALKYTAVHSPNDSAKIIKIGKKLKEDWELIEEKVEAAYPEDYTNIEESFYPLIEETQHDKPDTDVLMKLTAEVNDKLFKFKEKISA
ncbi:MULTISPECIES: hypothetical protein [Paraliobacillus]|uniref:hypothetical protein n=1 Tax=Paraliobacillus TaxID=200903 RepID=UPI000DD43F7A|nr:MULTISPECIES: hypothetical protein [Paraliobacillus]